MYTTGRRLNARKIHLELQRFTINYRCSCIYYCCSCYSCWRSKLVAVAADAADAAAAVAAPAAAASASAYDAAVAAAGKAGGDGLHLGPGHALKWMSSAWAGDPDASPANGSAAYRSCCRWPGSRDTWTAGRCGSESGASDWSPPCRRSGTATWCPDRGTAWTCCGTTWCDANYGQLLQLLRRLLRRLPLRPQPIQLLRHYSAHCPIPDCHNQAPMGRCDRCRRPYSAEDGTRVSGPPTGASRKGAAGARPTTRSTGGSTGGGGRCCLRFENEKEKNRTHNSPSSGTKISPEK